MQLLVSLVYGGRTDLDSKDAETQRRRDAALERAMVLFICFCMKSCVVGCFLCCFSFSLLIKQSDIKQSKRLVLGR